MASSARKEVSALYCLAYVLRDQTRRLWLAPAVLAVLIISVFYMATGSQSAVFASPLVSKTTSQAGRSLSVNSPVVPVTPVPLSIRGLFLELGAPIVAPQDCTPDTTYGLPSEISLANQTNGLNLVIDEASYYQVYGNTSAQIQTQIQHCAPSIGTATSQSAMLAAQTGYNLTWHYDLIADDTGSCTISNVKVGLRLNMVLPRWQPTASATSGLARAWQTYASNLAIHENGHESINQRYASQLLGNLQSMPTTDCGTISASIQTKVDVIVAALNASNDAYDARTNHGAKQGAILP